MEEITSQIARWGDLIEGLPAFLAPAALLLAAVVAALQLHALAFALLSRFTKTN